MSQLPFEFHHERHDGAYETVTVIRESDSRGFYICETCNGEALNVSRCSLRVFTQLAGDKEPKRHRFTRFESRIKEWLLKRQAYLKEVELEEAVNARIKEMGIEVQEVDG